MELNDQSSFLLHTIPSFISNEVKREFTTPHSISLQGNGIRGLHDSFYVVKWLLKYSKLRRNCNGYDTYAFGISFLAAIQVEVCGVMLGRSLATGKYFKSALVGYHAEDDGIFMIMDVAQGSRLEAWLRA
ncbi:hypothetical protein Tco_1042050 [Tanacetum coccineum]|uniref:Uncharacterized protein n=1 Tax=Tanacetum coccineum TaxID=301880 RepID=A0ABQ5GIG6_9ASTR